MALYTAIGPFSPCSPGRGVRSGLRRLCSQHLAPTEVFWGFTVANL